MLQNKLAIVIPYYKLTYFEETLKSLKNQTNQKFNLYIGNDKSPESPENLIETYSDIITKYKRFTSNIGGNELTKQWERCIDELTQNEEWIMILCDDDILSNTVVEDFYRSLNYKGIENINVIKYATRIVNEDATKVLSICNNQATENSLEFLTQKILENKRSTLSEHVFRRIIYDKKKFKSFELAFGSDDVAWIEFTNGEDILCINTSYVDYRKSILSISNNQDSKLKENKMRGVINSYSYILNNYRNKMNREQKKIFSKKIYNYFKALNYNNYFKQIQFLLFMIKINGITTSFKIIYNNKYYYEK